MDDFIENKLKQFDAKFTDRGNYVYQVEIKDWTGKVIYSDVRSEESKKP